MNLQTISYPNPLSAILEDFFSIRFKPHQVVYTKQAWKLLSPHVKKVKTRMNSNVLRRLLAPLNYVKKAWFLKNLAKKSDFQG